MAETVGQHSVAAFTSPVNGTSPIDANTVKGNDNTIRSAYVDHDADPGIHVQSSTLASRPVANSAGRKWMTQDSGVIRLFYDDGTSWYEVDYLRTTGGTISGNLSITGTLAVTGVATFTAQPILSSLTASRAVFTDGSKGLVSNAITGTGDVVMSASPTLTGTITAASATLSGTLGVSGLLTFASLKGTGATTVTNILDEDNMASDSATALATQQSIKAYVDAQVGASDALSEVLAIGNTTGANDIIVSAGQKIRTPAVAAQDGSSAITIANTTGALTLATALADSNLATISTAGKVSNSATTATSANTASAIVARDASGNFTAGTITAALTGNASTATTLQTARNINGVSFNGSADITVTAAAGTLTGTTLASNVTASSLTSVGTLANLTVTNPITGSVTGSSGSTTGNAATATALQTARNINGVSFNGTADITVTAAAGTLTGTTLASGVTASSLTSVGTLSSLTVSGDLTVDTSTLKVDSTNNRVGIGTASPGTGYRLHIVDSGNTVGTNTPLFLSSANGVATTSYGWDNLTSSYDYTFKVNGSTTAMTISNTGNLGIGTSSPGYLLDVQRSGSGFVSRVGTASLTNLFTYTDSNSAYLSTDTSLNNAIQISNGSNAIAFFTQSNAAAKATLDASGNLGLGVTPQTGWSGNRTTFQVHGTVQPNILFTGNPTNGGAIWTNAYYDGTNNKYIANGAASIFSTSGGAFQWNIAASGTAGNNATFTQAMTLDASGNLLVGTTTSAGKLTVNTGSAFAVAAQFGNSAANKLVVLNDDSGGYVKLDAAGTSGAAIAMRFDTGGTERARITSGGNVGIGTSSPNVSAQGTDNRIITVQGNGNFGGYEVSTGASDAEGALAGFYGFTFPSNSSGYRLAAYLGAWSEGATVNQRGASLRFFTQANATAGATERARITSGGDVIVGATTSDAKLSANGTIGNSNVGLIQAKSTASGDVGSCGMSIVKYDNNTTTSQIFFRFGVDQYNSGCGQINANGANQAAFGTFSDRRLKENIANIDSQWQNIKALRPVEFDYIESEGGGHQLGFIAQEVQEVYPDLVGERTDGMLTLSGMGKHEARLIKALQEAMARIESLEARLAALES